MAADWSRLAEGHNLRALQDALPSIIQDAGYGEMYGVKLKAAEGDRPAPHTTLVILQKYLRANADDVGAAKNQLLTSLKWRKEYQPLKVREEVFDKDKFGGLGFVTRVKGASETKNEEDVATFNIYGAAAKDPKKTFGDTDAFVRWRVALMELTLQELHLDAATETIPDYGKGPDPYKSIAVHDYLSVSFFRQPAEIKASSSRIIDMFHKYYPETVSYKYFINVPLVMQWMMGAMKALMSKDSIQTMTWMTYGSELHKYLGSDVPKEYGGNGVPLSAAALTPKYGSAEESKTSQAEAPSKERQDTDPTSTTAAEAVTVEPTTTASVDSAPADEATAVTDTTPEISGKPEEKATVA